MENVPKMLSLAILIVAILILSWQFYKSKVAS
jgi:hypothetical protein